MGEAGKKGNNRRFGGSKGGAKNEAKSSAKGADKGAAKDASSQKNKFERQKEKTQSRQKDKGGFFEQAKFKKNGGQVFSNRRHAIATESKTEPLAAVYNCGWCEKPIRDIFTAISDKNSGEPLHFDCVLSHLNETEVLDSRDAICYIGGGRFGVVHYDSSYEIIGFRIKKILEWEDKETCGDWRRICCERI